MGELGQRSDINISQPVEKVQSIEELRVKSIVRGITCDGYLDDAIKLRFFCSRRFIVIYEDDRYDMKLAWHNTLVLNQRLSS